MKTDNKDGNSDVNLNLNLNVNVVYCYCRLIAERWRRMMRRRMMRRRMRRMKRMRMVIIDYSSTTPYRTYVT